MQVRIKDAGIIELVLLTTVVQLCFFIRDIAKYPILKPNNNSRSQGKISKTPGHFVPSPRSISINKANAINLVNERLDQAVANWK